MYIIIFGQYSTLKSMQHNKSLLDLNVSVEQGNKVKNMHIEKRPKTSR